MAFDFTAIFGDAESMTKEQLETALQQKGIKLADLGTGKYVDAGKYQNAVSELDQLKQHQMTDAEKTYLNNYHADIYEKISPYLSAEEAEFLKKYTRAI